MNLYQPTITGSLSVSGSVNISGSITIAGGGTISGTASYATNAELLDGLDSTVFTLTSSFAAQTASFTAFTASILAQTASLNTFSASVLSYTSSLNAKTSSFATTGSNTFAGIQTINSNLIVTGSITATTLVVQTVTSSVIYSSGSNVFGNSLANTQTFTGSLLLTGSIGVGITPSNPIEILGATAGSNNGLVFVARNASGGDNGLALGLRYDGGAVRASIKLNFENLGATLNNYISFTTDTTEKMRITNAGNVGIGTTTPVDLLTLYRSDSAENNLSIYNGTNGYGNHLKLLAADNAGAGYNTVSSYTNGGNTHWTIGSGGTTNTIVFYTNNDVERMRITNSGSVGIGVIPSSFFEVYANSTTNQAYFTTSGSANRMIVGPKNVGNGALIDMRAHGSTYTETILSNSMTNAVAIVGSPKSSAPMVIGTDNVSPLVFGTNNTETMRITGGKVGIGVTSLVALLDVYDGVQSIYKADGGVGSTGAGIWLSHYTPTRSSLTGAGIFSLRDNGDSNYHGLLFRIHNTATSTDAAAEAMRITSAGNVGVNTAGSICKFVVADTGTVITSGDVTFDTQAKGIELYNNTSGTTDNLVGYWFSVGPHKSGIASGRTNAGGGWELDLRFFTHYATTSNLNHTYENMRLYGNGNLTINGSLTPNGSLSDINLKENLVKISSPLEKISQINGYNFDWKEGTPPNGEMLGIVHDAGLIAQEVAEVMPDIVRSNKWDGTKMLNYNGVIALLVEGMKELKAEFDAYKATHP